MEMRKDGLDLTAELRALRPSPTVAFTDELDARVAAGFAKDGEPRGDLLIRIARALRNRSPRQLALPAGALALTALVVATAMISAGESGNDVSAPRQAVDAREQSGRSFQFSDAPVTATGRPPMGKNSAPAESSLPAGSAGVQLADTPPAATRAVERDAELVLRSEPGEIDDAANEVFAVVHAARGIVLNSSIRDWTANAGNRAGEARAGFELLIPTARLGEALASLSRIADVRSRHESTFDITAPTVGIAGRLSDAEARIDGLLAQLAGAESDEERAAVESELHRERRGAAVLSAQLDRLRDRAHFARVTLRIEAGQDTQVGGTGTWGADDALRDAGRILAIAAGVAVIGLAVIGPLALIGLLAWLAHRVWLRRRRERALG